MRNGDKAQEKRAADAEAAAPRAPKVHARQILWLAAVVCVFSLSLAGSVILWETTMWDDYIDSQLVIRNNTPAYEDWSNSRVTAVIKYWLFNYTNVDEFRAGKADKLRVQEVGPYAFREHVHRVNAVFNDNGTVTFQERKSYSFVPELSDGSFQDRIVSINVVFFSMNYMAPRMTYFEQVSLWSTLKVLKPRPFVVHSAREWFWGYSDTLKAIAELKEGPVRNGIVESANVTNPDTLTVQTGANGMATLGLITRYAGLGAVDFYASDECNRVDGSDGARFPPPALTPGATLHIYHREACRRVPLHHVKDVTVWDGVPAMRFRVPDSLFANGSAEPANACYCRAEAPPSALDRCFPSGVINTHHCQRGAPLFASFPHFLFGDRVLLSAVDGLRPDPARHRMHVDIHQRVGATVGLLSRFQMSLLAHDHFGDDIMRKISGRIMPWLWMERTLEDFPEDLRATFRLLSFTAPAAHTTLRWACPLLAALTGLVLLVCLYVEVAALLRPDAPPHAPAPKDEQTRL